MVKLVSPVGGLSEARLREAEARLGVALPGAYRAFLLEHNGGRPVPAGFEVTWREGQRWAGDWRRSEVQRFLAVHEGAKANLEEVNLVDLRGRLPPGTVAVAVDPGGNALLLELAGPKAGRVLFWVREGEVEGDGRAGMDDVGVVAADFGALLAHGLG